MTTHPHKDVFRSVTPIGILLPLKEARKIAEILTTIQQVAGSIGLDLIERLDALDGDADLEGEPIELNGDELDATGAEDEMAPGVAWSNDQGPGCPISDPGGCEHDGREEEHDMEREQMQDDVTMLTTYDLDSNNLGIGNLQSSFRTNGCEVRSADGGKFITTRGREQWIGVPV